MRRFEFVFFVLCICLSGCEKEENSVFQPEQKIEEILEGHIVLNAKSDYAGTRTIIDGNRFSWQLTDTIGVIRSTDTAAVTMPFVIQNLSDDGRSASFISLDSLNWKPDTSVILYAYYPYQGNTKRILSFNIDSIRNQSDAMGIAVGQMDIMMAAPAKYEEVPTLHFSHSIALCDINLESNNDNPIQVEYVELLPQKGRFPLGMTYDLTDAVNSQIISEKTSSALRVTLDENFNVLQKNTPVTARFIVFPTDFSSDSLEIKIKTSIGMLTLKKEGMNFEAGNRYVTNVLLEGGELVEKDHSYANISTAGGYFTIQTTGSMIPDVFIPDSCASWISLPPMSKSVDITTLSLTVEENTTGKPRWGIITVNGTQEILVCQSFENNLCLYADYGKLREECEKQVDTIINVHSLKLFGTPDLEAIRNMESLQSIDLNETEITHLSSSIFKSSQSIEQVILPAKLTSLEEKTFYQCSNLQSVSLPENLTSINDECFRFCKKLNSIVLPEQIKTIGDYAFQASGLVNLVLPDSVEYVGKFAFWESSIQTITLPQNLKFLGEAAFCKCEELLEITIPDNITEISFVEYYFGPYGMFSGCKKLQRVVLPATLKKIGAYAFRFCESLTDINLPESISEIGVDAFHSTDLKEVIIPSQITELDAFSCCDNLTRIVLPAGLKKLGGLGGTSLTGIDLPAGLVELSDFAFSSCKLLEDIVIPAGLVKMSDRAFENCELLRNIVIPESVDTIGKHCFSGCTSLQSVKLPAGLKDLGNAAFENCTSLAAITIPEGITELKGEPTSTRIYYYYDGTFAGCTSLKEIVLPSNLVKIGDECFAGCVSLENIDLPQSLKIIGSLAFRDCSALKSLVLPSGVTEIGGGAFAGCKSFTEFTIPEGITELPSAKQYISTYGVFSQCSALKQVNLPESLITVGEFCFAEDTACKQIVLPAGVTTIGDYAFWECTGLKEFNCPAGVTVINNYSFAGCTALSEFNFPDGLIAINEDAFSGCINLTGLLDFPEGLQSIGYRSFSGCTGLTGLNLPVSLNSIAYSAFWGCTGLTGTLTLPENLLSINDCAFQGTNYSALRCRALKCPQICSETFWDNVQGSVLYVPEVSLEDYKNADYWKDFGTIIGE